MTRRMRRTALTLFLGVFSFWGAFLFWAGGEAQATTVQATVSIGICGNGAQEGGEECDGNDELGGATCQSQGFSGGTLSCDAACEYVTSQCTAAVTGGPGSRGGSSSGVAVISTQVKFVGKAYPNSIVTLLKDGQVVETAVADAEGSFTVVANVSSSGTYLFSQYAQDTDGRQSVMRTFHLEITPGVITTVSGFLLPPTISTDKVQIKKGEKVRILGQATPQSEVTLTLTSEKEGFTFQVQADIDGRYLYALDTSELVFEEYDVRATASIEGESSTPSSRVRIIVGERTVPREQEILKGDLNGDWLVNLVDFSIAVYWYQKPVLSEEFAQKERERLNGDGNVDLADISVISYFWTG